jgi:hypothetical protein
MTGMQTDSDKPGSSLLIVVVLQVFALLDLLGGAILFFNAKTTSVTGFTGGLADLSPTTAESHDWATGLVYLAAAIFAAALLGGFAHLIADVHDLKYRTPAGDERH